MQYRKFLPLANLLICQNLFRINTNKNYFQNVFQSSYFKPIFRVEDFLIDRKLQYKLAQSSYIIKQCMFCDQPHYGQFNNMFTLHVDKKDGKYFCTRCQKKGSWDQFKAKSLNIQQNSTKQLVTKSTDKMSQLIYQNFSSLIDNLNKIQYSEVVQYLKQRGFTEGTLQKYLVGAGKQTFTSPLGEKIEIKVIYFPMYQFQNKQSKSSEGKQKMAKKQQFVKVKLTKVKIRGASSQNKIYTKQFPNYNQSGFFGLNTIKQTDKMIVITQGEFDAMAVYQNTGYPTISLPQGANSLPDKLIPMLNRFQKIVLWMDNDEAGRLGAQKISYKLGHSRTYVVKHQIQGLKDANDFLLKSPQLMKQLISSSRSKVGQNIISYNDLKQSVKNRVYKHEQYIGTQIDWLPFFNKKVKGIRTQQISIVSGPTGCGKTTFLSQLSLDICKKQIPVLWGSFQIRNEVFITNMLIQYSGVNLYKKKLQFDHYAQLFKRFPLYWLSFHGSNDVDKVLATIEYSIQKHNISFVVLDTLQFLLSDQAEGIKKFDLQDKVMSRLRRIATHYNVHIVIVIHPRKIQHNQDVEINSIYGTSKAAQEADNIWMIQNRQNFRIFDIKKNRFDGDVGKVAIGYNKQLKKFIQLQSNQIVKLSNNEATIQQIIKQRAVQQIDNINEQSIMQKFRIDPQVQNQNGNEYSDYKNFRRKKAKPKNI